jgi:hypothetical protein
MRPTSDSNLQNCMGISYSPTHLAGIVSMATGTWCSPQPWFLFGCPRATWEGHTLHPSPISIRHGATVLPTTSGFMASGSPIWTTSKRDLSLHPAPCKTTGPSIQEGLWTTKTAMGSQTLALTQCLSASFSSLVKWND